MDRDKVDQGLEWGIAGLVLAILVFAALAFGGTRTAEFVVIQGMMVGATVLWVARFWVNRRHRFLWPPVCWAVVVFAVWAVVRYHQAEVEYIARLELARILVYGWLFLLVINNLHRQETTRILLGTLCVLGTLLAMYAVYQFLAGSDRVWTVLKPENYKNRGSGTYICPNHLAGLLEMLLPIALAMVFLSRGTAVTKVFYGYMGFVMLAGIGATVSRGGWIAAGVGLLVLFASLFRRRQYRVMVLVTAGLIALGAVIGISKSRDIQKRFTRMFVGGQLQDVRIRPNLWKPAIQMVLDHPWVGVGPAHFDVYFPKYRPVDVQTQPLWTHNDYLNALADWGVVGTTMIAVFFGFLTAGVIRTLRYVARGDSGLTTRYSDRAAIVIGVSIGLIAVLVHCLVDFHFHIPANAMVAVALMACLAGHVRFSTDRYWHTPTWLTRMLVTLAGVGCAFYLGKETIVRTREAMWLRRAGTATTGRRQLESYQAAFAAEPKNGETANRIGEIFRLMSWKGGDNWPALVAEAMKWFDAAMKLNPNDTYAVGRYGMCLDWQQRHDEATVFFDRALSLDPNNAYYNMLRGWHEIQRGALVAAKKWLERSLEIKPYANYEADIYLGDVNARLRGVVPP